MAALGDENICGLDVAVDDAFGVGGIECVGDLISYIEDLIERHGAAGDAMFQRLAVEVFHGDEPLAVVFVDFVDGADVGMIQRGGGLGFAFETGQGLRIFGYIVRQEFQGDEAVKFGVFGFVDYAHAAAAEFFDDAVMRDGLADHWGVRRNIRLRGYLSQRGFRGAAIVRRDRIARGLGRALATLGGGCRLGCSSRLLGRKRLGLGNSGSGRRCRCWCSACRWNRRNSAGRL